MSFKVKVLKAFKIANNCHIKTCWSLNQTEVVILKIPWSVSLKTLCSLSVGFETSKGKDFPVLR